MNEKQTKDDPNSLSFLLNQVRHYDKAGDLLRVAQPKRWVFVISLLLLIGAILVWSFFGRIPTEVVGKMIAVHPDAFLAIESKSDGVVSRVFVDEGEIVPKGALLATIYNPTLQTMVYKIQTDEKKLKNLTEEITLIESNLKVRERLYLEGLIARTVVDNTRIEMLGKLSLRDELRGEIVNLFSELERQAEYWDITIEKDPDSPKSYQALAAIEDRLSNLYAPEEVKVLEALVNPKDRIEKNQKLFWLEEAGKQKSHLVFYTAVPLEDSNKIRLGMTVYIEPQSVNNQEYGKIIGHVIDIYPFAPSQSEFLTTIKNPQIVNYLTEGGKPVALVSIEGKIDHSTVSGYAWTSKSGPPFKITPGTVGSVKIVVEEQPPISYLIPLWKLKPYRD